MPAHLHRALTFCYENGSWTGAMKKILWPWVDLRKREVSLPPGIIKNRKPLIVRFSVALAAMRSRSRLKALLYLVGGASRTRGTARSIGESRRKHDRINARTLARLARS
jgi:hypothetical protein